MSILFPDYPKGPLGLLAGDSVIMAPGVALAAFAQRHKTNG